ncbi:MAG: cyclic nucleotide-binding domain-containing protein [Rhodocyclaceae bacterium]|nr:cyclic nucleotide-binding domain-containing protein [Rhodocyclaceae bacterium]
MTWVKEEFSFHDTQRMLFKLAERVKAFQGLKPAEIAELLSRAEKCTFAPGMDIVNEGNVGMHMYVIIDGEAKVTKQGRDGEMELARLGPADSFGEMALADQEVRSASVKAIEACILVRLSDKAIDAQPAIGLKVYRNICRVMSERLRQADEMLAWRL